MSLYKDYIKLYNHYKEKYNKIALLYEVGTFYEMYGLDNEKIKEGNPKQLSSDLNIILTRANKKKSKISDENPLLTGFPSNSLDNYVKKLIDLNYTVIVYSQNEHKKRVLDKIISPGTFIDTVDQDELYISSIYAITYTDKLEINLSIMDLSTGKTFGYCIIDEYKKTIEKVSKLLHSSFQCKEIILNMDLEKELDLEKNIIHKNKIINKIFLKQSFQNEFLKKIFPNHGDISPIEYINLERYPNLIVSFIILFNFAYEHDEHIIDKIYKPSINNIEENLFLTYHTIDQLQINNVDSKNKSLFDIINFTNTKGGKRLLKQQLLSPFTNPDKMKYKYNDIELLLSNYELYEKHLKNIADLDRLHKKLFLSKLQPNEFILLDASYRSVLEILKHKPLAKNIKSSSISKFQDMMKSYNTYFNKDILNKFNIDNMDKPILNPSQDGNMDELSKKINDTWDKFHNYRHELSFLVDENDKDIIKWEKTKENGYYFVTTSKRFNTFLKDKKDYKFETKIQTSSIKLTNFYIKELSDDIITFTNNLIEYNKSIYINFLKNITNEYQYILKNISSYISYLDVIVSNAKLATLYNYCKPIIENSAYSFIDAKNIRHPIIERIYEDEKFVGNDVYIGKEVNGMLIYGVNGSGKSALLKSIGLCTILAQCGFYVPASSFKFYPYNNIITKISMYDNIYKNQSTFACEMSDLRQMLEYGNEYTLILADELCSGTETFSAIALVSASIIQLSKCKANFIFTTHLHQLKEVELIQKLNNIKIFHLSIDIKDGNIIYGREIKEGYGSDNYGIEIAKQLCVGNNEFIKNAISIRRKITNKPEEILTTKQSKYNKDVYMDKCGKCGVNYSGGSLTRLHTHHKEHQAWADKNNMINGYHKNRKSNLIVLCEKCHNEEHSHK